MPETPIDSTDPKADIEALTESLEKGPVKDAPASTPTGDPVLAKRAADELAELEVLKHRANIMGLKYHPNIGLETLRERVRAAQEGASQDAIDAAEEDPNDLAALRKRQLLDLTRLIRIRISCLNPAKREMKGEFITVIYKFIGALKKFIPFDEVSEGGYHVPFGIYQELKDRKFLSVSSRTVDGQIQVSSRYVPEFAIEVLPPLTPEELKDLEAAQAKAGGV